MVPAGGPYVQQWRAQGTILLSTGGACSGAATSKAGEEAWLPSPWCNGLMLWENWRASAWCRLSPTELSVSPCGRGGVRPPFIDQGGSESHARRAIWLCEGAWRAML
jgi:hypothetical protein